MCVRLCVYVLVCVVCLCVSLLSRDIGDGLNICICVGLYVYAWFVSMLGFVFAFVLMLGCVFYVLMPGCVSLCVCMCMFVFILFVC